MHRLAALTLCLALGACQSANPYRAESLPLPAPPESGSVAPAAPRDHADYRDWAWQDDRPPDGGAGLEGWQVRESLSAALDQRGLRPAAPGARADLRVSLRLELERRLRLYEDYYGDFGGYYGHGRYWDRYGAWGGIPVVRHYEEEVLAVHVELYDGGDGRLRWSGSAEAYPGDDRSGRAKALREALRRALEGFPP